MPSDSGANNWTPPAGSGERRLSNSSDGSAGSGYSKALSTDSDYVQSRVGLSKVTPGKPTVNPLQFVKVGPCDLYRSAQEQVRRAEEVKKSKEVKKEELEDWQSNLDNWKSSRRKRVEHIIERCVEVKRMENEPVPGARGKSKTFNEMLEERVGKRRLCPLTLYTEEEVNDLSDLGIGTSSTKSSLSEDCDTHSLASDGVDLDKNHSDVDNLSYCGSGNRKLGSSANEYDTCTTTTISSPEPEEYTYEGAIEGYKSRISSQTHTSLLSSDYKGYTNNNFDKEKTPDKTTNSDLNRIRATVSNKIEEKLSTLTQNQKNIDVKNNNPKKELPKVNILKRRETFEKESSPDTFGNKPRFPEVPNKKSIKERLSSLEKFTEENKQKSSNDVTKLPTEVVTLKERLSSLQKIKESTPEPDKSKKLSNGDLTNTKSVKERLSSFKSQTSEEGVKIIKTEVKEVSVSIKERLSSLDAARNKETLTKQVDDLNNNDDTTKEQMNQDSKENDENSLKTTLSCIENQMQNFCRSLDSLDVNGTSTPSSFERVQSLEDFESCNENHNNTSPSDIETEDSGIHTERGSCAPGDEANEMAELIQLETSAEEPIVSEYESSNEEPEGIKVEPKVVEEIIEQVTVEEIDEDLSKVEDTDSTSNYLQAVSQQNDDLSGTDEITEILMDKDDEDTLKSLDPQDTSVIDALELAFQEIDASENMDSDENNVNAPEFKNNQSTKELIKVQKKDTKQGAENIDLFYQNGTVLETVVDAASLLDLPANVLVPPKEKPPPPPTEDCVEDDVVLGNGNFKSTNSTRRIKKEIRNKRSSFLGLEGQVDDSYLDVDLKLAPRPDITSFLQQETKIEKLLYKKTLSHDMDSKLRESRDSGVDLDRGPSSEAWYHRHSSPETSNPHSRENSEPYTNVTVTSDEEEATRKETKKQQFEDTLQTKLAQIRSDPADDGKPRTKNSQQSKIDSLDKQLQEQQECVQTNADVPDGLFDDAHTKEVLRFERELLQLEQEELRRQRDSLLLRESQTRRKQKSVQDVTAMNGMDAPLPQSNHRQHAYQDHRHSMPNLLVNQDLEFVPFNATDRQTYKADLPYISDDIPKRQNIAYVIDDSSRRHAHYLPAESPKRHAYIEDNTRHSTYLMEERQKRQTVPYVSEECAKRQIGRSEQNRPPVPTSKPRSKESVERELTMRSSRIPSAVEYANVDKGAVQLRPKPIINGQVPGANGQYHPMSRHTLQVLSAAPTPKLISGAEWLQARSRKQIPPAHYNYNQHWLVQEAEQRRIEEQRSKMRPKQLPNQRHSYHQEPAAPSNAPHRMQSLSSSHQQLSQEPRPATEPPAARDGETLLSVSGKKKCSHCGDELGRGAAMIIESLSLCYHVWCFSCVVCGARLGDGRAGADVRVRARRLHCHQCYSSDDGRKFSCV